MYHIPTTISFNQYTCQSHLIAVCQTPKEVQSSKPCIHLALDSCIGDQHLSPMPNSKSRNSSRYTVMTTANKQSKVDVQVDLYSHLFICLFVSVIFLFETPQNEKKSEANRARLNSHCRGEGEEVPWDNFCNLALSSGGEKCSYLCLWVLLQYIREKKRNRSSGHGL